MGLVIMDATTTLQRKVNFNNDQRESESSKTGTKEKPPSLTEAERSWCEKGDSNPHTLTSTGT